MFDVACHPAHKVLMPGQGQLLPAVQVHGRCQGDVGDGGAWAGHPVAPGQARVQDAGELVELGLLGLQHRGIRTAAQQGLDAVLHQEHVAAGEPAGGLPQQPAVDVGPGLQVARVGRVVAALVGGVLQDGVGLPEHEVAVDHGRDGRVRVQGRVGRLLLLAGEVIDVNQFIGFADQVQTRKHLATVDGDRVGIDLEHACLLAASCGAVWGENLSSQQPRASGGPVRRCHDRLSL